VFQARARLAALERHRTNPNDPVIVAARAALEQAKQAARSAKIAENINRQLGVHEAKLIDAIKREAENAPPLSAEQRNRLAVLLLSGGDDAP
jgi:hypothetical protein